MCSAPGSTPPTSNHRWLSTTLVIDRFLRAAASARVKLVYENRMNPVIDALEDHLMAAAIPFSVQSGTIVDDTRALVNGRHLVFGFGTLGPAICYLSDTVETLVSFANGYDHKFPGNPDRQKCDRGV